MRIVSLFLALVVMPFSHTAMADEALRKKISDASTRCSGDGEVTKANASSMLARCEAELVTLEGLYPASQVDEFDRNWLNFHAGAVLILLAVAHAVENDNKLNKNVCTNALSANRLWENINAKPGSKLESDTKNDPLFNALVPLCKKAFKTK